MKCSAETNSPSEKPHHPADQKARGDILAAIRKRGEFFLEMGDAAQARRWGTAAVALYLDGVIDGEEIGNNRWRCTKGPKWNRRA